MDIVSNLNLVGGAKITGDTVLVGFEFDGEGAALTDGLWSERMIPFGFTLLSWTVTGDLPGSITFDIQKVSAASYPPDFGDSIVASAPPALSSGDLATSNSLVGWASSGSVNDFLRAVIIGDALAITKATLYLSLRRE